MTPAQTFWYWFQWSFHRQFPQICSKELWPWLMQRRQTHPTCSVSLVSLSLYCSIRGRNHSKCCKRERNLIWETAIATFFFWKKLEKQKLEVPLSCWAQGPLMIATCRSLGATTAVTWEAHLVYTQCHLFPAPAALRESTCHFPNSMWTRGVGKMGFSPKTSIIRESQTRASGGKQRASRIRRETRALKRLSRGGGLRGTIVIFYCSPFKNA